MTDFLSKEEKKFSNEFEKKGFVIKIWGPRMDSMKIKNFFDNSHFYQNALQFNFSCK